MNLKRVFAGVAAAATALGTLAIGAATANADPIASNPQGESITINEALAGQTFQAYQLATFTDATGKNGVINDLAMSTPAAANMALENAINTLNTNKPTGWTNVDLSANNVNWVKNNLALLVTTLSSSQLRVLAKQLAGSGLNSSHTETVADGKTSAKITGLQPGWYLVTCTSGTRHTEVAPAIMPSTVTGYTSIAQKPSGTITLGELNVKMVVPTPHKTIDANDEVAPAIMPSTVTGYTSIAQKPSGTITLGELNVKMVVPTPHKTIDANDPKVLKVGDTTVTGYTSIAQKPSGTITLGELNVKMVVPTPHKTIDANDPKVLKVGDTLHYTITSTLPAHDATSTVKYHYIIDTPGLGLTADNPATGEKNIKVFVNGTQLTDDTDFVVQGFTGANLSGTTITGTEGFPIQGNGKNNIFTVDLTKYATAHPELAGKQVTVTYAATVNSDALDTVSNKVNVGGDDPADWRGTDFTVDLTKYATAHPELAGKQVTVTYAATVNSDALDTVSNKVNVGGDDPADWRGTEEITRAVSQLQLKKVGVEKTDKNGAAGAMFELTKSDLNGGKALAFVQNGNTYTYAPNGGNGTVSKVTSQADGTIVIYGLPAGTYKVTETDVLTGYSSNFKAVFNATVTSTTKDDVTSASWNLASGDNLLGLATQATQESGTAPIQVKNVKSITQLPLTGAAGITILVVVALLIGGAAALIAVRSHSLKQQLRG